MSFGNRIRLWTSLTPLAAVLALAACDESPTAEGAGNAFLIDATKDNTRQVVDVQFRVDARALDRGLTPLPSELEVTPSSASLRVDSIVFAAELQESRIYITPTATDSTAYLVLSAGGVQDTVYVEAYPGSIVATVPADTLNSGASMNLTVNAVSGAGNDMGPVPFTIVSATSTRVDVTPEGVITGKGAGEATIVIGGQGGVIRDTVVVEVVPSAFGGTVTAGAVTAGSELTITAAAGAEFDDDTQVRFSAEDAPFIISQSATQIVAIVPFDVEDNALSISNVGENQLAFAGTFTLGATTDPTEPNDDPATAPEATLATPIYGSVGEGDDNDFFTLTVATAGTYTVNVEWTDGADLDVFVTPASGELPNDDTFCDADFLECAAASSANPEVGTTRSLAPGTYRVWINRFGGSGASSQYRATVTRN